MSRMRRARGLSLTAAQPQGLTFAEIKERVMEFMLANERISGVMAFGEGLDKDGATENIRHYDPVEEFNKENRNTDEIMTLVKCSIPDDHIDPRRSALFMARSVLSEVREGDARC